jgi:hypothetical protein
VYPCYLRIRVTQTLIKCGTWRVHTRAVKTLSGPPPPPPHTHTAATDQQQTNMHCGEGKTVKMRKYNNNQGETSAMLDAEQLRDEWP